MKIEFQSFSEFYPFYLSQHQNPQCRILHFVGTGLVIWLIALALILRRLEFILAAPVIGYGFAWIGHFYFEKNKPATFEYPLYSLMGDLKMFWELLTGRLSLEDQDDDLDIV